VAAAGAVLLAVTAAFVAIVVVTFSWFRGDEVQKAAPSPLPAVQLTGAEETVFSWEREACAPLDIPDLPARAFQDASGRVRLISSHYVTRGFAGTDLRRLQHPCDVLMRSHFDADPARYADREWIASTFTADGRTVYALVHDEYQGNRHPGRCPSGDYFKCWYNAITLAVSRDGGRTYAPAAPAPGHLVASVPYRYEPDAGPYGLFAPSNIVRSDDDGYYYALMRASEYKSQRYGSCLMRTKTLADPRSWRAWGGSDFDVRFADPYWERDLRPADHVCTPVSPNEIGAMVESLTYNDYLDKWLLVGASQDGGRVGFFYSVSDDLVNWAKRRLIREVELPWSYECDEANPVGYPSILDPRSPSLNYTTSGETPYLFFTRYHYAGCAQNLNRDMVRIALRFSR
jgi:hypothetical protein